MFFFGHDDYGQPVKVSEAFENPQGRYLYVSPNELAVPILVIVPDGDGTYALVIKMHGERFRMTEVSGDSYIYQIEKVRWLLYTAS
jgi:hypothetical protein